MHELVKQGNGEGGVTVVGAPDHAFGNQLVSGGTERRNLPVELPGNVAGTVRARPEFGHRAEIFLFGRGEPVEPHAEKTFIQRGDDGLGRHLHVLARNGRLGSGIPGVFAPFLKRIRIALRLFHDEFQGIGVDFDAVVFRGLGDGDAGGVRFERANII